jgi:hypothetical protein
MYEDTGEEPEQRTEDAAHKCTTHFAAFTTADRPQIDLVVKHKAIDGHFKRISIRK